MSLDALPFSSLSVSTMTPIDNISALAALVDAVGPSSYKEPDPKTVVKMYWGYVDVVGTDLQEKMLVGMPVVRITCN